MADAVVKIRIDSQEYDAKLKKASQALSSYFDTVRQGGGTLTQLDEGVMDAVKALGQMDTVATNTRTGMREMSQAITDLTIQYRSLTDEERNSSLGVEMSKSLHTLTERAGQMKDAMVDVEASIRNASSDTRAFDQLAGGANMLMSSFQTLQGASKLLGVDIGDNVEVIAKLQAAMAVTSGLTQIQTALQKQSAVMQGVQAAQTMALAAANAVASKSIAGATVAQAAFNAVANANPYVLLASAVIAVGTALVAFVGSSSKAKEEAEELARAEEEAAKKAEDARQSFVNAAAESMNTAGRISSLQQAYHKANSEIEKTGILKQAQTEFKKLGLECNSLNQAQDLLVRNGGKVIEMIRLQGEAAASSAARLEIFKQKFAQYMETTGNSTYSYYFANAAKDVRDLDSIIIAQQTRISQIKSSLGGGGGGRSGGRGRSVGKTTPTTDTNFAADSIMAQEKLVNTLTEKWKRASEELRDGYLRELEEAKKLLDQMTNTKPIEGGDKGEVTIKGDKMLSIRKQFIDAGTSSGGLDTFISELKNQLATADLGSELYANLTSQIADATLMQQLLEGAIKGGVENADLATAATFLKSKLLEGDISDAEWAAFVEQINAKIADSNFKLSFKNGSIDEAEQPKGEENNLKNMDKLFNGLSSVASGLQQMGIKLPEGVKNVMGVFQGLITTINAVSSIISLFSTTTATAQTVATTGNTIALGGLTAAVAANTAALSVNSAFSLIPFKNGGLVPHAANGYRVGGTHFSGDVTPVLANAGELILNTAQQGVLADALENQSGMTESIPYVSGEMIYLGLTNYLKRTGRGEIITTRR